MAKDVAVHENRGGWCFVCICTKSRESLYASDPTKSGCGAWGGGRLFWSVGEAVPPGHDIYSRAYMAGTAVVLVYQAHDLPCFHVPFKAGE